VSHIQPRAVVVGVEGSMASPKQCPMPPGGPCRSLFPAAQTKYRPVRTDKIVPGA
jgi:hypothetical protein